MKLARKIGLGIALVSILSMGYCLYGGAVTWEGGIDKPQEEWYVGVTLHEFKHAFWAAELQACLDAGEKYNFKVEVRDAEGDAAKQIAILDGFITKGADLIVLAPTHSEALVSAVRKANAAGIPVITLNRTVGKGAEVVTYVGADDYLGGRFQGELVAEALDGKGNIILLQGNLGSSPQELRERGLEDVLAGYPDIEIVAKYPCDWDRGKALAATQDALVRFPKGKIHGIVSQDSEMNMTALQAIKAAGRDELIGKIVCFDYPSYVKENILNGNFHGTVLQDPYQQAMICMDTVWLYLSGHEGHIPRPVFFTPLPKITKDNADLYPPSW